MQRLGHEHWESLMVGFMDTNQRESGADRHVLRCPNNNNFYSTFPRQERAQNQNVNIELRQLTASRKSPPLDPLSFTCMRVVRCFTNTSGFQNHKHSELRAQPSLVLEHSYSSFQAA